MPVLLRAAGRARARPAGAGLGAAAAVLFAVNITAVLPATPANLGVFQAACAAVLHTGWHVGYGDGVAYGVILQAVEVTTAILMGMPALLKEGMSWREVRLRAMHTTPVKLPARPSSRPRGAAAASQAAQLGLGHRRLAPSSTSSGSASLSCSDSRAGSCSVPAISSSAACLAVFGRKPDFIPKYTRLRMVGDDRERRLLGLDRIAARQAETDRGRVEQREYLLVL